MLFMEENSVDDSDTVWGRSQSDKILRNDNTDDESAADIFVHRVNFSINLRNVLEVIFTSIYSTPSRYLPHPSDSNLKVNEVAETVSVETTLRMFW